MPISARATLFFEDGKYGWSETYFQDGIDSLTTIYNDAIALANLRAALNGEGILMPYLRVSDEAIQRDSLVQQINLFTTTGAIGKPPVPAGATMVKPAMAGFPDRPYSAILLRFEATSKYHRPMFLRGIPDDLVIDPIGPANNAAWAAEFLNWRKAFTANASRWKIKVLSKEAPNDFKKIIAATLVVGADTEFRAPAHGYVDGDRVRVEHFTELKTLNGVRTVQVIDANNFLLKKSPGSVALVIMPKSATVHRLEYVYRAVTDVLIRGQTHRDTGRPFDSPRGRRKARPVT